MKPHAEIYLGAFALTAAAWEASFYPAGMRPADYVSHYEQHFSAVEGDATFICIPKTLYVVPQRAACQLPADRFSGDRPICFDQGSRTRNLTSAQAIAPRKDD